MLAIRYVSVHVEQSINDEIIIILYCHTTFCWLFETVQLQNIVTKLELSYEQERTDLALLCARHGYTKGTVELCKSAKSPEKLFIQIAVSDAHA